jgi:acyl-CoA thioester hydrolase
MAGWAMGRVGGAHRRGLAMACPCDAAMVPAQFSVRVTVRSYEIDSNGHVNHAVYHQYGEHARSEHLRQLGFNPAHADHLGVVLLESTIRFRRELRLGDEIEVTSRIEFGAGRAFRIEHVLTRGDGVPVAEIGCVLGLFDTEARRLVAGPKERLMALATRPELLAGS